MIYGYLCEDVEHEIFLDHALPALAANKMVKCKQFLKAEEFCNLIKPPSASDAYVKRNFVDAAKQGFTEHELELFIAVIDFDSRPLDSFEKCYKDLHDKFPGKSKMEKKIANRSILAIPVRTIEYWLWYLKHQNENPNESHLENNANYNSRTAKKDIFGIESLSGKKFSMSRDKRIELSKRILQNADYEYLTSKSPSFNYFLKVLRNFCSTH